MTIIEALGDAQLLGALPAFRELTTWQLWVAFLRAVYGLPLEGDDLATFQKHTGRTTPRPGGYPEAVAITGCQSGKSAIAATVAAFEAATSQIRGTYAVLVAQDARSAQRVLFNYAREPFRSVPIFAREVANETADTLELASGVSLAVYPCRPAAVRGIRACVAVVDELAYFIASDGRPTDREMLRAVRTRLATTGGKLLILSSPYGQSGALWDSHRSHYGREGSPVLVWTASAPAMNPTLPADYLDRMREEDPEAYRSEVLGEFRSGVGTLFDAEVLEHATDRDRRESLPAPETWYQAHFDASGGRADAAALAIGHRDGDLVRVDLVRRWPAPHNPETVIEEAVGVLKSYRTLSVQLDRYGGEFPVRAFGRHGVRADVARATTAEHYLGLLPLVNAGRVRLADDPTLLRELRLLERRTGSSGGRDRVDHRRGEHDDVAAATAGVVSLLAEDRDCGVTL